MAKSRWIPNAKPPALDRLHAAMLLQKGGQTTALRALLQAEGERGSDFHAPRQCLVRVVSARERRETSG